jgi:hypothetical protein
MQRRLADAPDMRVPPKVGGRKRSEDVSSPDYSVCMQDLKYVKLL